MKCLIVSRNYVKNADGGRLGGSKKCPLSEVTKLLLFIPISITMVGFGKSQLVELAFLVLNGTMGNAKSSPCIQ